MLQTFANKLSSYLKIDFFRGIYNSKTKFVYVEQFSVLRWKISSDISLKN